MFFKKREEMPKRALPVNEVLDMKQRGMSNQQIIQALRSMGYSMSEIKDAISQAEIKGAVNEPMAPPQIPDMPPMPPELQMTEPQQPQTPPQIPQLPQPQQNIPSTQEIPEFKTSSVPEELVDELQRVIEKIISEKWEEVDKKLEELEVWKAGVDQKVNNAISRIKEFEKRLDEFSTTLLKREDEFKKSMDNVNVEMQALEKMLGKLIPSLADEIKELRNVVNKIKNE